MSRVGIIAGEGILPLLIGKSLISKNYSINFFCIKGMVNLIDYRGYDITEIEINSLTNILNFLKVKNIDEIIMAGKVTRPSIQDINFDLNTISLIKDFVLEPKGDDAVLKIISNFFKKNGYPLFNWKLICNNLFSSEEHLSIFKPTKFAYKNLKKGLDIFKIIGNADIGQSMIIQNQLILGVESLEGTDELIKRCSNYRKKGDRGILLKLGKYNQHNILDLPTIGINTLINIKEYSYEGIFFERNECIILDKEKIIDFCNKNNLFFSSTKKIV